MAKSVTYSDLEGTAPVVSVGGIEFEDGKAVEVEDEELAAKLDGSVFFDVEGSAKRKPGRPRKVVDTVIEPVPERPLAVLAEKEAE